MIHSRLSLLDLLGALVLLIVPFSRQLLVADPGVGWHLRFGEIIRSQSAIPPNELFLYGSRKPIILNQWLSDVLFSWLAQSGPGLDLFFLVIPFIGLCAHFILVSKVGALVGGKSVSVFIAALVALALGSSQWILRPVILSFLFFSLVNLFLWQYYLRALGGGDAQRRPPFLLFFAIFALWANCHPAFVFGLLLVLLVGVALLTEVCFVPGRTTLIRPLAYTGVLFLLCLVSTFLNPYGVGLYKSIFSLVGDSYFSNLNQEWLSPSVLDHSCSMLLILVLVLLIGVAKGVGAKFSFLDTLVVLVFIAASLHTRRYIPFAAIALSAPLVRVFDHIFKYVSETRLSRLIALEGPPLITATVFVLLFSTTLILGHLPWASRSTDLSEYYPEDVLAFLPQDSRELRILSVPDWGGYLIWRLWPRGQVYADDRNLETGKERYEDFFSFANAKPGWDQKLKQIAPDVIILPEDLNVIALLGQKSGWVELGRSSGAVVFGTLPDTASIPITNENYRFLKTSRGHI